MYILSFFIFVSICVYIVQIVHLTYMNLYLHLYTYVSEQEYDELVEWLKARGAYVNPAVGLVELPGS